MNDLIFKLNVHVVVCLQGEFLFELLPKVSIHCEIIGAMMDVINENSMDKN